MFILFIIKWLCRSTLNLSFYYPRLASDDTKQDFAEFEEVGLAGGIVVPSEHTLQNCLLCNSFLSLQLTWTNLSPWWQSTGRTRVCYVIATLRVRFWDPRDAHHAAALGVCARTHHSLPALPLEQVGPLPLGFPHEHHSWWLWLRHMNVLLPSCPSRRHLNLLRKHRLVSLVGSPFICPDLSLPAITSGCCLLDSSSLCHKPPGCKLSQFLCSIDSALKKFLLVWNNKWPESKGECLQKSPVTSTVHYWSHSQLGFKAKETA